MAESTLALTRTEIKQVLGVQAGWSSDSSTWSANESAQIDRSIKRGLRMAYFRGYKWEFLEPVATLTIFGTVTGTTSGSQTTTVTATTAKFFPTMIGQSITFDTSGTSYTISGYTSATVITVSATAAAEASGDTFTITPNYAYRLPDDFAYILGPFTHPSSSTARAYGIVERNEGLIRSMRESSTRSGPPECFAVRPVDSDGSAGQRFEVLFAPNIDGVYPLEYKYSILPDALVDSTNEYPLGGASHGEMILAACRAALDMDLNDRKGAHYEEFVEAFNASVARDTALGPQALGYMSGERGVGGTPGSERHLGSTRIDVNGSTIYR